MTMQPGNPNPLYNHIDELPSLPSIVNNLLDVTANPESSASDVMQVILPDPAMCSAILKIANSAFFGLPREVNTVEKAVMVLGFDEIRNIVLGKAVFNSFSHIQAISRSEIEKFWTHSFHCGLAAKILAEQVGGSPSEMFLAGLIHDIGKLAILTAFSLKYTHLLETVNDWRQYINLEKEHFLINHEEAARRILNKWLFPHSLVAAIGFHHHPENAEDNQVAASLIQIADSMAHFTASQSFSAGDYYTTVTASQPDLFDILEKHSFPCREEEVSMWVTMLQESKEKDTAILSIFSS